MKKIILLLFVLPLFVFSQNNPDREYWQTNKWEAKTGMSAEFESAVAEKTKKFNNSAENAILTFQVITGPDQGKYMRVVGPKESSFFDEPFTKEYSYWEKNVMPFVKDNDGNKRSWRIPNLGYNWNNGEKPMKYIRYTVFRLKSGLEWDFFHHLGNVAKLRRDKGFSGKRGVFAMVSGGQWEVHVVDPYDTHSEPIGKYAEDDLDFEDTYNEMFGWRALQNLSRRSNEALRDYGGEVTETLMFRPEMSTSME